MKKLNQVTIVLLVLIIGVSSSFASENDVKATINEYLSAINKKETKTIDSFVNDDANFTMLNSIIGKKEVLDQDDYLDFVKQGKAGAWVTSNEVKLVNLQGDIAVVYAESEGKTLIRKEYFTLVMNNGQWEIVNSVSTLAKK